MSTFFDCKGFTANPARVEWASIDLDLYGKFEDFVGLNFIEKEIKDMPIDVAAYIKGQRTEPTKSVTLFLPKNVKIEDIVEIMKKYYDVSPNANPSIPSDIDVKDFLVASFCMNDTSSDDD